MSNSDRHAIRADLPNQPIQSAEEPAAGQGQAVQPVYCYRCGGPLKVQAKCPECGVVCCAERCLHEHDRATHRMNRIMRPVGQLFFLARVLLWTALLFGSLMLLITVFGNYFGR